MGDIAEMMLDGTMDPETGEFNFDGEDGPGFPMTGEEARAWKRGDGPTPPSKGKKARRNKGEKTGKSRRHAYVCQVPLTALQFDMMRGALLETASQLDGQDASEMEDLVSHMDAYAPRGT